MVGVLAAAGYLEREFVLEQYGKLKTRFFPSAAAPVARRPAATAPQPAAGADTARPDARPAAPDTQTPVRQQRPERPARSQFPTSTGLVRDDPFVSDDTGTIDPGMSEAEVYALWGAPVGVRRAGEWTYLYFRNGCEWSCGTYDLVFLQSGKVVDAVLRWPGHNFSGQSTSPPGVVPLPTRGGDTLVVPTPDP